jgi:hypothetical protein
MLRNVLLKNELFEDNLQYCDCDGLDYLNKFFNMKD